jgi:type IV pilus assembly protein PilV
MSGSSLIEILVSIILLSFGLLGMVGLQAASMQNNREARLQSTGVRLATELAERMRGNHAVAIKTDPASNPYLLSNVTALPAKASVNCVTTSCATPLQVATWEINEWLRRMFATDVGLPGARVVVCFDTVPYDNDGLPVWDCTGTGDIIHIKLGWTRASTDRSRVGDEAMERVDAGSSRPSVLVPVVAGLGS